MRNKPVEKIPRCCCTCDRNKRIKGENGMVSHCECEIDGHYIGYLETFEYSCKRYVLDKAYKPGGKWYEESQSGDGDGKRESSGQKT